MKMKILIVIILAPVLLAGCHESNPDWEAPNCPDDGLVVFSKRATFSNPTDYIVKELMANNWSNIKLEQQSGFMSGGTWVNADCPEAYEMEGKGK